MKELHQILLNHSKDSKSISAFIDSIHAFSEITGIPVTLFNTDGLISWESTTGKKICRANKQYFNSCSKCRRTLNFAMKVSKDLGEVYIFVCDSGLINLAYALSFGTEIVGYFLAGPIAMGNDRTKTFRHFYEKTSYDEMDIPKLMEISADIRLYNPKEITYLTTLYDNCFLHLVPKERNESKKQAAKEQNQIVTKIVEMKENRLEVNYPVSCEESLLSDIQNGNRDGALKEFSKYVEEIMVFENGNMTLLKIRLMILLSKAMELNRPYYTNSVSLDKVEMISNAATLKEMMAVAGEIICRIADENMGEIYIGNSAHVISALSYIHGHFNEPISLSDISEAIHVNKSYLSSLFKKELGTSVTDYLTKLRLEYAKQKIRTTNASITDIAFASGYDSLSYFTSQFTKTWGISPQKFRKNNNS